MARITIPEPARVGLSHLASLPDDTAKEFLKALETVSPTIYRPDLLDRLSNSLPTVPQNELTEIIDTLFGLSAAEIPPRMEISEFIGKVIDTLVKEPRGLSEEQLSNLKQRLIELLTTDAIRIGGKARNILFENECNLLGARIISDIRPIFGDEVKNPPIGAIIVHSLKIEYLSSGKRHEFYVALDTKDVESLLAVLERAKDKTSSLQALLASTSVRYVEAD